METIGIQTSAMLVELNISSWTARKLDRRVSDEVDATKATRARAGNYNKNFVARPQLTYVFGLRIPDCMAWWQRAHSKGVAATTSCHVAKGSNNASEI